MTQSNVRSRALGALLTSALTRWESLVTIALTGILFLFVKEPFPWWQDWFWLIAGLIAEGALVVSTLTDPILTEQIVQREFERRYDLKQIKSAVNRKRLEDALEYRRSMIGLLSRHQGAMRQQLQQTISDVNVWIEQMVDLALHIDSFEENELVDRDRRSVPNQLEKVRIRLDRETDERVRVDLEAQARLLEKQLENLNATANSVKRAEIQLDSTLSSLGTIYAQMSHLGAKDVDSARAQRLRLDIQEEVASLQDTIYAMDDVQAQRLTLG